jgi:hypothetical protein
MLPTKFRFIWQSGFKGEFWFIWLSSYREEDFKKSTNQKQALPMAAMFVYGSKRNKQLL